MALVQVLALLGVTYWALPYSEFRASSEGVAAKLLWFQVLGSPAAGLSVIASNLLSYDLIVKLLWLQIVTAPCYGLSVVVSSVLQAARRYDFIPRLEVAITILRFAVLVVGLGVGIDFFWVIVAQIADPGRPVAGAGPVGDGPRPGAPARISAGRGWPTTRRSGTSASTWP